jgi:hypothetical protein
MLWCPAHGLNIHGISSYYFSDVSVERIVLIEASAYFSVVSLDPSPNRQSFYLGLRSLKQLEELHYAYRQREHADK